MQKEGVIMTDEQTAILHRVQTVELEILREFDKVCRKNNLKYSLAYGTLIGAVRHKGFIPWDDDIDVVMPRDDYEKLKLLWKDESSPRYILQDYRIDVFYQNNFMKIRKNNTSYIQGENEFNAKYHTGIFIDIFPMDRLAPCGLNRKKQYLAFILNLLYSRGRKSGKKGVFSIIESFLLFIPRKFYLRLRDVTETYYRKWNGDSSLQLVSACTFEYCKMYFDSDLFDNIIELMFEGNKFLCTAKYDSFLRYCYDDYMKLPPENERIWKHNPQFISFDKNYKGARC